MSSILGAAGNSSDPDVIAQLVVAPQVCSVCRTHIPQLNRAFMCRDYLFCDKSCLRVFHTVHQPILRQRERAGESTSLRTGDSSGGGDCC